MNQYTDEDVKKRTDLLRSTLELLQFSKELPYLITCLENYGLCESEIPYLQNLATDLEKSLKIRLSDVPAKLNTIYNTIGGLKAVHMKYFQALVETQEVVTYIGSHKEFDKKVAFLNGDLQGYKFGLDLLNNVISVKQIIDPFVEILKLTNENKEYIELSKLCKSVYDLLKNLYEDEFLRRIEKMRNVLEHIQEIKVWFSRTTGLTPDTILPFVHCLLVSGNYHSTLSLHDNGDELSLHFTENTMDNNNIKTRKLPRSNLQDLVCGMTIFINQDTIKEKEKLNEISKFVTIYRKSQEIHQVRLQLEAAGHPGFQGDSADINKPGHMEIDWFNETHKKLLYTLSQWESSLEEAYKQYNRLQFLDYKQLAQFMTKLDILIKNEEPNEKEIYLTIYPYVSSCFPDYARKHNNKNLITSELIFQSYTDAYTINEKDLENSKEIGLNFLKLVTNLIKNVEEKIVEKTNKLNYPIQDLKAKVPERVTAFDLNDFEIFRLIIELCDDVPPHFSQLLWCNNEINESTLMNFLKRTQHFQHLPYVILGVNKLQLTIREKLLDWISNLFIEEKEKNSMLLGPLYLVFTEHIGVEVFSFLKEQQKNSNNILPVKRMNENPLLNAVTLKKERKIETFECIHGQPSTGKSHYIKNKLNELEVKLLFYYLYI